VSDHPPRLTWRETLSRIRADHRRIIQVHAALRERGARTAFTHPSFVCALMYRLSHHSFRSGHRLLARFLAQLNTFLTGADISEPSDLGAGLVIVSPAGVSIFGNAGRNLTLMPLTGLGGQIGREDDVLGGRPGLPLLGDDVVLEPYSGVLGPVRVGHRSRICTGIALTRDVPDDTIVESPLHEPRVISRRDA
jgi:serine O-acetyltransferase